MLKDKIEKKSIRKGEKKIQSTELTRQISSSDHETRITS
jgi:hypothetical protein